MLPRRIFISWEPPPPRYIKINFDGSVKGWHGGAGFIVRGSGRGFIAARGGQLCDPTVPWAKLRAAEAAIRYARLILRTKFLIVEGDSVTIISWIRNAVTSLPAHPLIRDIALLLLGASSVLVRHIYREANSAANWMALYVAQHTDLLLWTDLAQAPVAFRNIFFDFFACIHSRSVE